MSFSNILKIAGSGLSAQTTRLNTTASNLANANTVNGDPDKVYRAKHPVFSSVLADQNAFPSMDQRANHGVSVTDIIESQAPIERRYSPGHALANKEGYVYLSNVNTIEEMANMLSAQKDYQTNIEMINTTKSLVMRAMDLLQS